MTADELMSCIVQVRKVYDEMPAQMLHVFLVAASHEGQSIQEIGKQVKLSAAAMSRNVAKLGGRGFLKPGLGLLETRETPENRRLKLVFLTAKGSRLLKSMESG